jgi:hypothetical protein
MEKEKLTFHVAPISIDLLLCVEEILSRLLVSAQLKLVDPLAVLDLLAGEMGRRAVDLVIARVECRREVFGDGSDLDMYAEGR